MFRSLDRDFHATLHRSHDDTLRTCAWSGCDVGIRLRTPSNLPIHPVQPGFLRFGNVGWRGSCLIALPVCRSFGSPLVETSQVKLRECGIFYGVQSGQPGRWHLPLEAWRARGTTADEFEIGDDRHWPSHRHPRPHLATLTAGRNSGGSARRGAADRATDKRLGISLLDTIQ